MANIYGMILARFKKFPQIKTEGIRGLQHDLVLFVSQEAHYSFVKGSIWMGHGSKSVIKVRTDAMGHMDVDHLDECIQKAIREGKTPYMIGATAGTTVLGSFDPIMKIKDIAKKYDLWLHVDAALGGTVLFSKTHRRLMSGVEFADSVTWNLHKLAVIKSDISYNHPNQLIYIISGCTSTVFRVSDKTSNSAV